MIYWELVPARYGEVRPYVYAQDTTNSNPIPGLLCSLRTKDTTEIIETNYTDSNGRCYFSTITYVSSNATDMDEEILSQYVIVINGIDGTNNLGEYYTFNFTCTFGTGGSDIVHMTHKTN